MRQSFSTLLSRLGPFRWSFHNLIAHPLSEIAHLAGFGRLSDWIHDSTVPEDGEGTGRG